MLAECGRYDFNKKDRWGKSALDLIKWSSELEDDIKKKLVSKIKKDM